MSYNHNARKVVIDGPQPVPDANPWLSLDTPMTYADGRVLYIVPGSAIVGMPSAYRPHPELTAQKNIWIPQGGANTDPTTHANGRDGQAYREVELYGEHGGDAVIDRFLIVANSKNALATHYTAQPYNIRENGSFALSLEGAGATVQHSELLFDDFGYAGGLQDRVRNFNLYCESDPLATPRFVEYINSGGTKPLSFAYSTHGKMTRVLDTVGADLGVTQGAVLHGAGQRVYWNASGFSNNALCATTYGEVYTDYNATAQAWEVCVRNAPVARFRAAPNAINFLTIEARETGIGVIEYAEGADANIGLNRVAKGGGPHMFWSHGMSYLQVLIEAIYGACHYIGLGGGNGYVEISARSNGGGADADVKIAPLGAGKVRFGTSQPLAGETVTGYIVIKDAAGALRKLAVVS